VSRQLVQYGQQTLPPDVLDSLSSSYDGVLALYNMMKGKEPVISSGAGQESESGERKLQKMMRDPKYWKERDPSFVAEVTEQFKKLYDR
jgi:hypothetical protein